MAAFFVMVFVVLIVGIITAVVGSRGLWHAIITFFNVLVSALVATNYFEPISEWLDYALPSFTYLIDFLVLWSLFAFTLMILRTLTDMLSRVKVRFLRPVDLIGGFAMSLWTAWIFVCFAMTTIHTAALPRDTGLMGGIQPTPEARSLYGMGPDWQWLSLVHWLSENSLAKVDKPKVFDPQGDFILRYAARRHDFEKKPYLRVDRDWGKPEQKEPPQ